MNVLTESPTSSDHSSLKRDKNRQKHGDTERREAEGVALGGGGQEVARLSMEVRGVGSTNPVLIEDDSTACSV